MPRYMFATAENDGRFEGSMSVTAIGDVVADNAELLPTPGARCSDPRAELLRKHSW
jgi:hypothetical protein